MQRNNASNFDYGAIFMTRRNIGAGSVSDCGNWKRYFKNLPEIDLAKSIDSENGRNDINKLLRSMEVFGIILLTDEHAL